ncbi:hypothetical protein [Planktotalea sp.]|uniref:hypothetical protein n=1 Tax=Planktotalea sp. TaxID=2029877 RepID=UPI003F6A55F4
MTRLLKKVEKMPHSSEHSGQSTSHMHGSREPYEPLKAYPFDTFERNCLTLARMFFVSFHHPERHAWVQAFQYSETAFGAENSADIAKHVMDVVNTMRQTRSSGFSYCDPFCVECSVMMTREERYLISALHDIRNGRSSAAHLSSMLLCEGADDAAFINALEALRAKAHALV